MVGVLLMVLVASKTKQMFEVEISLPTAECLEGI